MLNDLWLLISAILIVVGLLASQGLLIIVGSLVIVVWLLTKFWNRYAFEEVSHGRSLSQAKAFIGDEVEYTVTLSNEKIVPLIWVDIQDALPVGLELAGAHIRGTLAEDTREHRITTSLLPYQRVSWKYAMRCNARGYYRLGPARLRSGDIFGFTAAEQHLSGVEHILVYPRVLDLQDLILPAENPLGEAKGRQPIFHDQTRFIGLRDYQPQDPMKHVDWKATARKSALQTKIFEPVVSLEVLIALNATTGEHAWQGTNRRLFERSVTTAASVAGYCAGRGYSFGLVSNSVAVYSGKWINVAPGSAESQLPIVLEALAVAGSYSVASLADVIRAERGSFRPGATIALVTALVTPGLVGEIHELRGRGFQVIVFFSGDGGPRTSLGDIPVHLMGPVLDQVESL